jgi:glycosyltransferase involved in cell wall biosynthesis
VVTGSPHVSTGQRMHSSPSDQVFPGPAFMSRADRPTPRPLHILILTDRDWTHAQGGGTGANVLAHVRHWLAWGHRVTVLAGASPGALAYEQHGRLTVHRRGGRKSVFPHTFWRLRRGLVPDADVVLEIINGITFLTPLWLRLPHVAYIHHVHRDQYIAELGLVGRIAAFVLETTPLRRLYRRGRFVTVSHATAAQLTALGVPEDAIEVNYHGPDTGGYGPGPKAARPTLLYLGRLKRYKRIECLLDLVERVPEVVLEIAGDGDHRPVLEREIAERGLSHRVRMHGFVDEPTKLALLQEAWALVTASSAEGWGLTALEAAACATPTVALAVGGLTEAIADGHTGLLAVDEDGLAEHVRALVADEELRRRLGENARVRAESLGWRHTAERTLAVLEEQRVRHESRHSSSRKSGPDQPAAGRRLTIEVGPLGTHHGTAATEAAESAAE